MKRTLLPVLGALLLALTACNDKETEIGLGLTDPATLYNGKADTIYASSAYSLRDDSLLTSNYSFGIIGNYNDPTFGRVSSTLYSQIGLASGMSSINFDEVTIDSVVLTLVSDGLFPDTDGTYNLPNGVALNEEENEEYARISSDVTTYASSELMKFLMGQSELNEDTFAAFRETMISMGAERMEELYQQAYERYLVKIG